ncbi:MAG: ABC transporter permease [Candidatus Micrarchaeia archaeon]|jgi:putative ABC transport system permease protein
MAFGLGKYADFFAIALSSFSHRRTRTLLTMIGIFIGIAAVVSLFSLGEGLQNAINSQFESLGSDKVIITPGSSFGTLLGGGSASAGMLVEKDLDTVRRTSGVARAAGMGFRSGLVSFSGEAKNSLVLGIPNDPEGKAVFQSLASYQVSEGRWPKENEKYAIVIGYLLAHDTVHFKKTVSVGDKLKLMGKDFAVVGVIQRVGNKYDDTQMYVPMKTMQELYGSKDYYMFFAQAAPGVDTERLGEELKRKLRIERGVKENYEDFMVQTPKQLQDSFNTVLSVVQAIVIAIASISLLVGGIGIMNTMYTSVLERTREIGTMKAIGARNGQIAAIFMIESGLLGLIGGAVGAAIGIGMSLLAQAGAQAAGVYLLEVRISPELVGFALLFSFVVGMLSGVLPALQAAKLNPVEALRYE